MPSFNIVKTNNPKETFRVSKIEADFDIKPEQSSEHFEGSIEFPNDWHIGVIVGGVRHWKNDNSQRIIWRR